VKLSILIKKLFESLVVIVEQVEQSNDRKNASGEKHKALVKKMKQRIEKARNERKAQAQKLRETKKTAEKSPGDGASGFLSFRVPDTTSRSFGRIPRNPLFGKDLTPTKIKTRPDRAGQLEDKGEDVVESETPILLHNLAQMYALMELFVKTGEFKALVSGDVHDAFILCRG